MFKKTLLFNFATGLTLCFFLTMATSLCLADTKNTNISFEKVGIYYFSDDSNEFEIREYKRFAENLKATLSALRPTVEYSLIKLNNKLPYEISRELKQSKDLAITIGEKALLTVLASRSPVPVFSLKTPRITLDRMRKIYQQLHIILSGIYREQKFENQLKLAKIIDASKVNAYLLLGMMSRYSINSYKKAIKENGFNFNYKILKNQNSPVTYFENFNPKKGILFLLDNPQQFSNRSIELLLTTSFHHNIPMIGNKKEHTEHGAIASVYSSNSEIIKETSEVVNELFNKNHLREPSYLDRFSVRINQQIAENLGYLKLREADILKQLIELSTHE